MITQKKMFATSDDENFPDLESAKSHELAIILGAIVENHPVAGEKVEYLLTQPHAEYVAISLLAKSAEVLAILKTKARKPRAPKVVKRAKKIVPSPEVN